MQICICVLPRISDIGFLALFALSGKTGLSDLADSAYDPFCLNWVSLLSYVSCIFFIHSIVAHNECIHIGEALLVFLVKCAKWRYRLKLNSILYAHIEGELTLYV
jgi:hypothetical protein